ncbi:MAG: NDP-sugar synthase, partial [Armatimonadota bacterium]|nr:NDP-sugar synthase [Armatimonadota bacterium]
KKAGIEKGIIVVSFHAYQVRQRFCHQFEGLFLDYVEQGDPLGTGHALKMARPKLERAPFLVLNGDDLLLPKAIVEATKAIPSLVVAPHPQPTRFGIVQVQNGFVKKLVEKPQTAPPEALVSTGAYCLPYECLSLLDSLQPAPDGELRLTDIMGPIIEAGLKAVVTDDGWIPVTYPWDVLLATARLLSLWGTTDGDDLMLPPIVLGTIDPTARVEGPVRIEEGAVIGKEAFVLGPSVIGRDAFVGEGTVVEGSVLGARCRIGSRSVIRKSILFDDVTVGSDCHISTSVIGRSSRLEDAVRVKDRSPTGLTVRSVVRGMVVDSGLEELGCLIAEEVVVGKGVVLYPGVKVWPGQKIRSWSEAIEDVQG